MKQRYWRFNDWPLRSKLAIFLVAATMLPLGIASWLDIRDRQELLLANATALLQARGDELVHRLDTFNTAYMRSATRLSRLPATVVFASGDMGRYAQASIGTGLKVWPQSDTNIYATGIVDASAKVKAATADELLNQDLSGDTDVRRALAGEVVVSEIHFLRVGGAEIPVITFLSPITDANQKITGLAAIWIRASALWDVMRKSNGLAGPGSFAVLFDHYGIRIAHTYSDDITFHPGGKLSAALIEKMTATRRFGEQTRALLEDVRPFPAQYERSLAESPDENVFRGFAPVNQKWNYGVARRFQTVPWTVFYMLPEDQLNALIVSTTRNQMLFAAGFILLALLTGLLFGGAILKPIRQLSIAIKRVSEGDYRNRVDEHRKDELGQLGSGFNIMTSKIEEQTAALNRARDELELRVQQRTAELEKITQDLRAEILERQRAEEATHSSHQMLQSIIDNAQAAIYVKDIDGRYSFVNRHYCEIFSLDSKAIVGKTDFELFEKSAAEGYRAIDRQVVADNTSVTAEETAVLGDGIHSYISLKSPLRDVKGQARGTFGISTDITERKLSEKRLEAQLVRLNLLDQITRAIGERQDLQSIYQVVIRSLEDQLPLDFCCACHYDPLVHSLTVIAVGMTSQALALELAMPTQAVIDIDQNGLSKCIHGHLVYEADLRQVDFPFPRRLAGGNLRALVISPLMAESQVFGILVAARYRENSFSSGECEFLRQLSEHVALAAQQAQLYAALQQAYDDLKQTQQAAMQDERLRALGQMASGIAHDINNAISPVALYTEALLEKEPNLSERARGYLQTIERAISDVSATVARMREFYRQREPQLMLVPVQLNDLIRQVVDLTRARWNDMPQQRGVTIQLKLDLDNDLPLIRGIEVELREALINLVFNAVDAMPDGGTLALRTRVENVPTPDGDAYQVVRVDVADSGVGMSEEIRQRCIEPFFTTKGERGTGLGLAMVYGALQRHSADFDIQSALGQGTTFSLRFTIDKQEDQDALAQPEQAQNTLPSLRILVVDDDPVLLKSLEDILLADGHKVVTANSGQSGIDIFMANIQKGETFSVVITDLGMPYVDGRKVASAVKKASPNTPILLLTGWGQRLIAEGDIPPSVDVVLSKPPKLRALRSALANCTSSDTNRSER